MNHIRKCIASCASILFMTALCAYTNHATAQYTIKMEGSGAYVAIPPEKIRVFGGLATPSPIIDFSNPFTIELWVKPSDLSIRYAIFSTRMNNPAGSFQMEVGTGNGGTGRVSVTGPGIWLFDSENHVIEAGQWVHIAYSKWGNTADDQALYVNGVPVEASLKNNYAALSNYDTIILGALSGSGFNGNLGGLRIWTTPRTSEQVKSFMLRDVEPTTAGLLGSWKMDEGSGGTFLDATSKNPSGQFGHGASWSNDPYPFGSNSGSIDFDGSIAFIEMEQNTSINFQAPFTVELWVKPEDMSIRTPLFSTRLNNPAGAFQIEIGPGSGGTNRVGVSGLNTWLFDSHDHAISTGVWTHIAYSRWGNSVSDQAMYVNGVAITPSLTTAYSITNNNHPYRISSVGGNGYRGYLTQLRVWEVERTQAQISANLTMPFSGSEAGLAGYWRMDESAGNSVFDQSPKGNHGVISGHHTRSTDTPGSSPTVSINGIHFENVHGGGPITLDTDFTIFNQTFSPLPLQLHLDYFENEDKYVIYGHLKFELEGHEIEATLGTSGDPGLIIQNGKIQQVNLSITEDFKLAGLEIETKNLGMEWKLVNGSNEYHIYGEADFKVSDDEMDADFGTPEKPGIIISNNKLKKLDVKINSNLKLGNITLIAKDLRIDYEGDAGDIFITGEVELNEVFELKVDLGDGGSEGLIINVSGPKPRFEVENLAIEIDHANLGAIDLKKLRLVFDSNGITESDVQVVFPNGMEVDAVMKFGEVNGSFGITSIDIDYFAAQIEDGIEVFEGVQLVYLEGAVKNIDTPHNLEISGAMDLIYGGGITLDGYSATLLKTGAEVTITPTRLSIFANIYNGAYRTINPIGWHYLLGYGSGAFVVYYDYLAVGANISMDMPNSPAAFLNVQGGLTLRRGSADFLGGVTFFVPDEVPVFGGDHIASAEGAFRYVYQNLGASYIAAWATKYGVTKGAKYRFGGGISIIGSDDVKSIKSYINQDVAKTKSGSPANSYTQVVHSFEIDSPAPNHTLFEANWFQVTDTVLINVIGPDGFYDIERLHVTGSESEDYFSETTMNIVANDSSVIMMISKQNDLTLEEMKHPKMTPGRYHVVLSFPGQVPDNSTVKAYHSWQPPEISLQTTRTGTNKFELQSTFWSSLPDSTMISYYVNDLASTDGGHLIAHIHPDDFDIEHNGELSMVYSPHFSTQTDSLYFYAIIEDRMNSPVKSRLSEGFYHSPDIGGTITFPAGADSLRKGLRIFLDENGNSRFDTASTGGLDVFGISDENGKFSIHHVDQGIHRMMIVLPRGYRIAGTENRFSHIKIDFSGMPIVLDLEIESYTE